MHPFLIENEPTTCYKNTAIRNSSSLSSTTKFGPNIFIKTLFDSTFFFYDDSFGIFLITFTYSIRFKNFLLAERMKYEFHSQN